MGSGDDMLIIHENQFHKHHFIFSKDIVGTNKSFHIFLGNHIEGLPRVCLQPNEIL